MTSNLPSGIVACNWPFRIALRKLETVIGPSGQNLATAWERLNVVASVIGQPSRRTETSGDGLSAARRGPFWAASWTSWKAQTAPQARKNTLIRTVSSRHGANGALPPGARGLVLFGPTNGTHIGLSGSERSRRTTRTGSAADSDGGGFSSQLDGWQEPCEEWLRSMNIGLPRRCKFRSPLVSFFGSLRACLCSATF